MQQICRLFLISCCALRKTQTTGEVRRRLLTRYRWTLKSLNRQTDNWLTPTPQAGNLNPRSRHLKAIRGKCFRFGCGKGEPYRGRENDGASDIDSQSMMSPTITITATRDTTANVDDNLFVICLSVSRSHPPLPLTIIHLGKKLKIILLI